MWVLLLRKQTGDAYQLAHDTSPQLDQLINKLFDSESAVETTSFSTQYDKQHERKNESRYLE